MRIIAGIGRGLPLSVPRGANTRPTSDRVREAVFSSLGERVVDADVLDLFAGTGALGLEAASRGAKSVTFAENDRNALDCLQKNLQSFRRQPGMTCELEVIRADVFTQLRRFAGRQFNLIFADPPYGETPQKLLDEPDLPGLLAEDGVFVLESAKRDSLSLPAAWTLMREAVYGDTRVSMLRK